MEVTKFDIEGLFLFKPKIFGDDRGYFIGYINVQTLEDIAKPFIKSGYGAYLLQQAQKVS